MKVGLAHDLVRRVVVASDKLRGVLERLNELEHHEALPMGESSHIDPP